MKILLLLRNRPSGAAQMLTRLSTGVDELPAALGRFGGRAELCLALVGTYDAAIVATFDDPAGVLAYSLSAHSQGQEVVALPAFDGDELTRAEEVAAGAARQFAAELEAALAEGEGQ